MAELGEYIVGPQIEEKSKFTNIYAEPNWHAKTWRFLPGEAFSGPPPGSKQNFVGRILLSTECFLMMWDERIQRKIVKESNLYAEWVDPTSKNRMVD
jgi:hypothetical protein